MCLCAIVGFLFGTAAIFDPILFLQTIYHMIKIKLNSIDEKAKWRSTDFKREWTQEDIDKIDSEYDHDLLFIHFDDGIDLATQRDTEAKPKRNYKPLTEADDDDYNNDILDDVMSMFGDDYKSNKSPGLSDDDDDDEPAWAEPPPEDISTPQTPPPKPKEDNKPKFKKARSFSEIQPQATFNPKTIYQTPIGIYTYPWEYAKSGIFKGTLPFAQDKQFLYIYVAKDPSKVVKLSEVESKHLFEKSIHIVRTKYKKSIREIETALKNSSLEYDEVDNIIDLFFDDEGNLLPNLPSHDHFLKCFDIRARYSRHWFYFVNNIFNRRPVKITNHLQNDLGIHVLSDDDGEGIIHSSEPTQAIIFNPAFAKLIGVKINPAQKRNDIGKSKYTSKQNKIAHDLKQAQKAGLNRIPLTDPQVGDKVEVEGTFYNDLSNEKIIKGNITIINPERIGIVPDSPVDIYGNKISILTLSKTDPTTKIYKVIEPKEKSGEQNPIKESKIFSYNKQTKMFKFSR